DDVGRLAMFKVNDTPDPSSAGGSIVELEQGDYYGYFIPGVNPNNPNNIRLHYSLDESSLASGTSPSNLEVVYQKEGGDPWVSLNNPSYEPPSEGSYGVQNAVSGLIPVESYGLINLAKNNLEPVPEAPLPLGAGGALSFAGSQYQDLGRYVASYYGSTDLWVRWNGTLGEQVIYAMGDTQNGIEMFHNDGLVNVRFYDEGVPTVTTFTETLLESGGWTHLALYLSRNRPSNLHDGELFVNAREYEFDDFATSNQEDIDEFRLGADRLGKRGFTGLIDHLRFFDAIGFSESFWQNQMCLQSTTSSFSVARDFRFDLPDGDFLIDHKNPYTRTIYNQDPATQPARVPSTAPIGDVCESVEPASFDRSTTLDGVELRIKGNSEMDLGLLYKIERAPNHTNTSLEELYSDQYYGYYLANASQASYSLIWNYEEVDVDPLQEENLRIAQRTDPTVDTWQEISGTQIDFADKELVFEGTEQTAQNQIILGRATNSSIGKNQPGSGYALSLDGTGYVEVTNPPASDDISIQAWVKWDGNVNSSGENYLFSHSDGQNGYEVFHNATGQLFIRTYFNGAERVDFTGRSLFPNRWTNVVVRFQDGSSGRYEWGTWIDGDSGVDEWRDMDYAADGTSFVLGASATQADGFHGNIDELRLWGKLFNSSELRSILCQKISGLTVDLKNYVRFDEGEGSIAYDRAQSDRELTVTNAQWQVSGAPLGDLSSTEGVWEDLQVTKTGNSDLYLYKVNELPNSLATELNQISTSGYYGYFVAGSFTTLQISFDPKQDDLYDPENLADLNLGTRPNNAGNTWSNGNATVNLGSGILSLSTTEMSQELILGTGNEVIPTFYPEPGSGYAKSFDNVDEYLMTTYDRGHEDFTAEFWFRWSGTLNNYNQIFGMTGFSPMEITGQFRLEFDQMTSNRTIIPDEWTHVAVTFENTDVNEYTLRMYINGLPEAVDIGEFSSTQPGRRVQLGGVNIFNENFRGDIDEYRLWSRALSVEEIRSRMTQKIDLSVNAPGELGLVQYLNFDENGALDGLVNDPVSPGIMISSTGPYVQSGAPLGDASVWTYENSSLTIDNFTIETLLDTNEGLHLYRVNEGPNSSSGFALVNDEQYFGYFIINPSPDATSTITYEYEDEPFVQVTEESTLQLGARSSNANALWAETAATLDLGAKSLSTTSTAQQSEVILTSTTGRNPVIGRPGSGYSLIFDEATDRFLLPTPFADPTSAQTFTVETWVKWEGAQTTIFDTKLAGVDGWDLQIWNDGVLRLYARSPLSAVGNDWYPFGETSSIFPVGRWTHVALSFTPISAGEVSIQAWVNGVEASSTRNMSFGHGGTQQISVGGTSVFLDELRVWSKALSTTEVRSGMTRKTDLQGSGLENLIHYMRFDENGQLSSPTQEDKIVDAINPDTDIFTSAQFELSGAPLGDENVYSYAANSLTLGELQLSASTSTTGFHIYRIDEAPNTASTELTSIYADRYYGYYLVDPMGSIDAFFNYDETDAFITDATENGINLAGRGNNAGDLWGDLGARRNPPKDRLKLSIPAATQEIILAAGGGQDPLVGDTFENAIFVESFPYVLTGSFGDYEEDIDNFQNLPDIFFRFTAPACDQVRLTLQMTGGAFHRKTFNKDGNGCCTSGSGGSSGTVIHDAGNILNAGEEYTYSIAGGGDFTITLEQVPYTEDLLTDEQVCLTPGGSYNLRATAPNQGAFNWSFNGSPLPNTSSILTVSEPGLYELNYTYGSNCSITDQAEVFFELDAGALAGPTVVIPTEPFELFYDQPGGGPVTLQSLEGGSWLPYTNAGVSPSASGYNFSIPALSGESARRFRVVHDFGNCGTKISNELDVLVKALQGDDQANPFVIDIVPATIAGSNLISAEGSSFTDTYTAAENGQNAPDVFYQITAPACAVEMTASTCGSSFNTFLHVLDATGAVLSSVDNNCGDDATVTWGVDPGQTYLIVVEGAGAAVGDFTLDLTATEFEINLGE
ncbi:MAG: LamG-like jellyroll fold domain-containing protein, partial [Bacteroidota bacterium]